MEDNVAGNILSAGLAELTAMKNTYRELESCKAESVGLEEREKQLEKQIKQKEKELSDNITAVTKARRAELEATYNEQMERTRNRMKKIRTKKDKQKNSKILERIQDESMGLKEERAQYKGSIRMLFREEKCPRYMNNAYFYAIYQPIALRDFLTIILTLAVVLFVIPCGLYYFFFRPKVVFLAVMYAATVLVFGAVYLFLRHQVKEKHTVMFEKVRELRLMDKQKRKEIVRLQRQIRRDRDESGYGLDKFNEELTDLESAFEAIEEEKVQALRKYDNETRKEIADEVSAAQSQELTGLYKEQEECDKKQRVLEEKIKALSVTVSKKYNAYLGKENMDVALMEQLEEIMRAGDASTIGEALQVHKSRNASSAD